jgi:predicted transcriptional regulator
MSSLIFDPSQRGLRKTLKKYEEIALQYLWKEAEGKSSIIWKYVNKELAPDESISRASIINCLNDMVDNGVLNYREATGKGGHHRVYSAALSEPGYTEYLTKTIISSLLADFPEETKAIIKEIL